MRREKKGLQFDTCLIHLSMHDIHFSVCFISWIFSSICLNDAGFIMCFDLNTTGRDIWKLSYFYGVVANT